MFEWKGWRGRRARWGQRATWGRRGKVAGRTRRPAEGRLRGAGPTADGEETGRRRLGMPDGGVDGNVGVEESVAGKTLEAARRYTLVGRRVRRDGMGRQLWRAAWLLMRVSGGAYRERRTYLARNRQYLLSSEGVREAGAAVCIPWWDRECGELCTST